MSALPASLKRTALAGLAASLLSGLLLFACQTADPKADGATISFKSRYDQLAAYDLVRITLKSSNGSTLDLAFQGKVEKPGDLENLPVPHWDGGAVIVSIIGYKDGAVAYWVDTHFDGRTNAKGDSQVFVVPGMALKAEVAELPLLLGDSVPLPVVTVQPAILADKSLSWTSSSPAVVQVGTGAGAGTGYVKALGAGKAKLTARLNVLPSMSLEVAVDVAVPGVVPESLTLSPDTLRLTVGGAAARPTVQIRPEAAGKAVAWSLTDSLVAKVDANGSVQGSKAGTTLLRAASKLNPPVSDIVVVVVSDSVPPIVVPEPVAVAQIRFQKESTEIFLGGAAEDLAVDVLPADASNKAVDFTAADTSLILLKDGRISARALGEGTVIASSRENPLKRDTLKVKVSPSQVITAVSISSHAFTLYTGGEGKALTGQVTPSTALQTLRWRSGNAAVAKVDDTGKVTGVAPGKAWVYGLSAADSLKRDSAEVTVKTDAPVLTVGKDTTVFVGRTIVFVPKLAPQEYGTVVAFKWDIDGVPGWDDTSAYVITPSRVYSQPGVDSARFYVRDTEGNVGTAAIRVTVQVDTALQNAQNADLQALKAGGVAQVLVAGKTEYTLKAVAFADSTLAIEATTVIAAASVEIQGQTATHTLKTSVPLDLGPNSILITVRSGSGISKMYTLLVTRSESNRLSSIVPTAGALKPAFDPAVRKYTMLVPGDSLLNQLQWKVTAEDPDKTIRQVMGGFEQTRIFSGGFSRNYSPDIGKQTISFGVGDGGPGDSLYDIGLCAQGFKSAANKATPFNINEPSFLSMAVDGNDTYLGLVNSYSGGMPTVWRIRDTAITVVSPGIATEVFDIALEAHGGQLLAALRLPAGSAGSDSGAVTIQARNSATGAWSAHSSLPVAVKINSHMDMISFNSRLFLVAPVKSDSGAIFEYKSNAWSQVGGRIPMLNFSQFFAVGSNLYSVTRQEGGLAVRKLGASGFAALGGIIDGNLYQGEFDLSEDAAGRPIVAATWSAYPSGAARLFRLQSGSWTLMQAYTTTGNVGDVSLLKNGNQLIFYYDKDGESPMYVLDEGAGTWKDYARAQIGPNTANGALGRLVKNATGIYLYACGTFSLNVYKYSDCAGY